MKKEISTVGYCPSCRKKVMFIKTKDKNEYTCVTCKLPFFKQ